MKFQVKKRVWNLAFQPGPSVPQVRKGSGEGELLWSTTFIQKDCRFY